MSKLSHPYLCCVRFPTQDHQGVKDKHMGVAIKVMWLLMTDEQLIGVVVDQIGGLSMKIAWWVLALDKCGCCLWMNVCLVLIECACFLQRDAAILIEQMHLFNDCGIIEQMCCSVLGRLSPSEVLSPLKSTSRSLACGGRRHYVMRGLCQWGTLSGGLRKGDSVMGYSVRGHAVREVSVSLGDSVRGTVSGRLSHRGLCQGACCEMGPCVKGGPCQRDCVRETLSWGTLSGGTL